MITRSVSRYALLVAACTSVVVVTAVPGNAYPRPGLTLPAAISNITGEPTLTGKSGEATVSANGRYVAFTSWATDLHLSDPDPLSDVFRFDRQTGTVDAVSVAASGAPSVTADPVAAQPSRQKAVTPSISANGRYVAFWSSATNLVPGDTNLRWDAFVRDMNSGQVYRVNVSSSGDQATEEGPQSNATGGGPSLSASGRFVAFTDSATNLATRTPEGLNVFVHDMRTGKTEIESLAGTADASADGPPEGGGGCAALSPDGHHLVFTTSAHAYLPDDAQPARPEGSFWGGSWVVVRDLRLDKNEVVLPPDRQNASREAHGGYKSSSSCGDHPLSRDGRHVVFMAGSKLFVPNDQNDFCTEAVPNSGVLNGADDAFVKDLSTGRVERVSVTSWGGEKSAGVGHGSPSITSDGRYVILSSMQQLDDGSATSAREDCLAHATAPDGRPNGRVWLHDRVTGTTQHLSRATGNSSEYWKSGQDVSISPDGRFAVWEDARPRVELGPVSLVNTDMVYWHDRGLDLGATIGSSDALDEGAGEPPICVGDVCIPPSDAAVFSDGSAMVTERSRHLGGDLSGASLAYRPQYDDLFVSVELEHMPTFVPGFSPMFYGMHFEVNDVKYEVRATGLKFGTFGLFDCTGSRPLCTKVADLRGGYGTTGMRVVFSLPLEAIGLEDGGELSNVEAFSALGVFDQPLQIQDRQILDRLALDGHQ